MNHTQTTLFDATQDKPYLGDPAVVDSILRNLCIDYMTLRIDQSKSEDPQTEASKVREALPKLVDTFSHIMLGESDAYEKMPQWNAPGGIDASARTRLDLEEQDPQKTLKLVAVRFLQDVDQIMRYAMQDDVTEEDWNWQPDALIESYTRILLGLPDEDINGDQGGEANEGNPEPPAPEPPGDDTTLSNAKQDGDFAAANAAVEKKAKEDYYKAMSSDFQNVLNRIESAMAEPDETLRNKKLAELDANLPEFLRKMNASPKTEQVLLKANGSSLVNGMIGANAK